MIDLLEFSWLLQIPVALLFVTIGACLGLCINAYNGPFRFLLLDPDNKADKSVYVGILATVALGCVMTVVFLSKGMWSRPGSEIGDFLAGFLSPLALLWIVVGTRIQSAELREQRHQFIQANETQSDQLLVLKQELSLAMSPTIAARLRTEILDRINVWDDFAKVVSNKIVRQLNAVDTSEQLIPDIIAFDRVELTEGKRFFRIIDSIEERVITPTEPVRWYPDEEVFFDQEVHEVDCTWKMDLRTSYVKRFQVLIKGILESGEPVYGLVSLEYDEVLCKNLAHFAPNYRELVVLAEQLGVYQDDIVRDVTLAKRIALRAIRGYEHLSRKNQLRSV